MHKERAEKQKSLFAPSRKEGSERSIDSHSHSLASRSPPASPVRVGGTSLATAAAGGGLSSLSARLDSPSGGRPRLQLAPRTKPLPKLEIKKVPANDVDAVDDENASNQDQQNDAGDNGKQGGSDKGNASTPSEPGKMKILTRPRDQKKEEEKTGKNKAGKNSEGKVIDVAASKRLISGALGGLGGKSGKGGAKSTGDARVVGETEVVSAPDGTVSYRITIGGDDDDDDHDHDHDDETASASSSTGPNRSRGNRRGRGRGGGGRGGRGGRAHGGRGRGRTGGGGRGRGGDGEEKSKASKSEKKQQQQHRAPSRFEKQSDGSVKLHVYKGKSSKGSGKGGATGNTKQTGSKQSSLSAAVSKGSKK